MATETVVKTKKSSAKPKASEWPALFSSGLKTRKNFTRIFGTKDEAQNYVPWEQIDAENLASLRKVVTEDGDLLKYALTGLNAERRQDASLAGVKRANLAKKIQEIARAKGKKLTQAQLDTALNTLGI